VVSSHRSSVLQKLPVEVRRTLSAYLKDVNTACAGDLQSVVLYGSAARGDYLTDRSNVNLLLVLWTVEPTLLTRHAKIHRRWNKEGLVVPLFLTPDELRASADLYPLEYTEMQDDHVVLAGEDPFENVPIDPARLLLQCRKEISGNTIRLRQRFVEGAGSPEAISILLGLSVTSLLPALRGLLRTARRSYGATTEALLEQVQSQLGLDVSAVKEAWGIKRAVSTPGPLELPRVFGRYLTCLVTLEKRAASMKVPSE
jgi:predicted nucleotidyltransferase